jgi:hypothetical protein
MLQPSKLGILSKTLKNSDSGIRNHQLEGVLCRLERCNSGVLRLAVLRDVVDEFADSANEPLRERLAESHMLGRLLKSEEPLVPETLCRVVLAYREREHAERRAFAATRYSPSVESVTKMSCYWSVGHE